MNERKRERRKERKNKRMKKRIQEAMKRERSVLESDGDAVIGKERERARWSSLFFLTSVMTRGVVHLSLVLSSFLGLTAFRLTCAL